jgi:hypothetical protein
LTASFIVDAPRTEVASARRSLSMSTRCLLIPLVYLGRALKYISIWRPHYGRGSRGSLQVRHRYVSREAMGHPHQSGDAPIRGFSRARLRMRGTRRLQPPGPSAKPPGLTPYSPHRTERHDQGQRGRQFGKTCSGAPSRLQTPPDRDRDPLVMRRSGVRFSSQAPWSELLRRVFVNGARSSYGLSVAASMLAKRLVAG